MAEFKILMLDDTHIEQIQMAREHHCFYNLNVSPLAAVVLNEVLRFKFENTRTKRSLAWKPSKAEQTIDDVSGGGLFVQGNPKITINNLNEVGIYFYRNVFSYIRAYHGPVELEKTIKERFANALNELWKYKTWGYKIIDGIDVEKDPSMYIDESAAQLTGNLEIDGTNLLGINKPFKITKNQYRVLYEFLKGRDIKKLIKKYGQEAVDSMMSKKIDNQFIISAVEGFQQELEKTKKEYHNRISTEFQRIDFEIEKLYDQKFKFKKKMEAERDMKLADIRKQMKELISTALESSSPSTPIIPPPENNLHLDVNKYSRENY